MYLCSRGFGIELQHSRCQVCEHCSKSATGLRPIRTRPGQAAEMIESFRVLAFSPYFNLARFERPHLCKLLYSCIPSDQADLPRSSFSWAARDYKSPIKIENKWKRRSVLPLFFIPLISQIASVSRPANAEVYEYREDGALEPVFRVDVPKEFFKSKRPLINGTIFVAGSFQTVCLIWFAPHSNSTNSNHVTGRDCLSADRLGSATARRHWSPAVW